MHQYLTTTQVQHDDVVNLSCVALGAHAMAPEPIQELDALLEQPMTPTNRSPSNASPAICRMVGPAALVGILAFGGVSTWAQGVDAAAADATIKANKCTKCHSVDKKKDGPSFKQTASKYKGKADAEAALVKHLTTSPKVKIDGVEEEHTALKGGNEAEARNLARWILAH